MTDGNTFGDIADGGLERAPLQRLRKNRVLVELTFRSASKPFTFDAPSGL
jgi:hypothetical protein